MENSGILLVDGEIAYHSILRALLSPFGRSLYCVTSAGAAMEAIVESAFALILMDMEMPDIDGIAAAATCPVIAFTGLHPDAGEQHFLRMGMDGYLPKPFDTRDVAVLMQRWIGPDTGLQPIETPHARLAALLGAEDAGHMIDRFHAALRDAVDAGEPVAGVAHRIGGLAGTLGFATLSSAWLTLQDGGNAAWPTVRALSREALARHADGDSAGPMLA